MQVQMELEEDLYSVLTVVVVQQLVLGVKGHVQVVVVLHWNPRVEYMMDFLHM